MGPDRQHFVDRTSRQQSRLQSTLGSWLAPLSFWQYDQRLHTILHSYADAHPVIQNCSSIPNSLWIEQTIWLKKGNPSTIFCCFPKPFASDIEFLIEPMRSYIWERNGREELETCILCLNESQNGPELCLDTRSSSWCINNLLSLSSFASFRLAIQSYSLSVCDAAGFRFYLGTP